MANFPFFRSFLRACAAVMIVSVTWFPGASFAMPAGNDTLAVQPGELVINGDAESSGGWSAGLLVHPHGVGGYPGSVIVDSTGLTGGTFDGGTNLFSGSNASSTSTQSVDVSASATAIDSGMVTADVSAYIGGFLNQNDRATVGFTFRDAGNAVLEAITYGPVTNADRGDIGGFIHHGDEVAVPVGTRVVRVTISTTRSTAPANDGYVDNVSLQLSAPVPTATDDEPATVQDEPVTFNPTDNDTAVGPATIDPGTVRLLDGGSPVTTLTNADGTYDVNTATGEITFTPAPGFTGTATPVGYRVSDSNGQSSDATITVTVGPIVGVSIFNGPVALGALGVLGLVGGGLLVRRRMVGAS